MAIPQIARECNVRGKTNQVEGKNFILCNAESQPKILGVPKSIRLKSLKFLETEVLKAKSGFKV